MPLDGALLPALAPTTTRLSSARPRAYLGQGPGVSTRRRWAQLTRANAAYRARRKGLACDLTVDWLERNLPVVCPVLGIPLQIGGLFGQGQNFASATVDRIDNAGGYTPGNCLIVSARANSMKRALSLPDLRTLAATRDWRDVDDFSRLVRFYGTL
jgi:hypothetical protein